MADGKSAKSESRTDTQVSRRQALAKLGLGAAAIYAAPTVLSLSEARASSGGGSGGSGGGSGGASGGSGGGTSGSSGSDSAGASGSTGASGSDDAGTGTGGAA